MEPGQTVAIWINDEAAKLFLGLKNHRPVSRWLAVGAVDELRETPIGMWVDVFHIMERRPQRRGQDKRVRYTVTPSRCLIRWDYINTVQLLAEADQEVDMRPTPGQYL
jgi:hypothetical protein